jgi:mannose/fructose/N-acetylgalactosamine-specific phosphotransferase system component IID
METASADMAMDISKDEWDNRKLSLYGRLAGIFDIVMVFSILACTAYLIQVAMILPGIIANAIFCLIVVLWILALKGLLRILDSKNSYQTIIIRQN